MIKIRVRRFITLSIKQFKMLLLFAMIEIFYCVRGAFTSDFAGCQDYISHVWFSNFSILAGITLPVIFILYNYLKKFHTVSYYVKMKNSDYTALFILYLMEMGGILSLFHLLLNKIIDLKKIGTDFDLFKTIASLLNLTISFGIIIALSYLLFLLTKKIIITSIIIVAFPFIGKEMGLLLEVNLFSYLFAFYNIQSLIFIIYKLVMLIFLVICVSIILVKKDYYELKEFRSWQKR